MGSEQNTAVVSVFMEPSLVPSALNELRQAGCTDDQIGLMMAAKTPAAVDQKVDQFDDRASEGVMIAAAGGAALAALAGVGASLSPGVQPAVNMGSMEATGVSMGSALQALALVGIPEGELNFYHQDLKAGGVVLMAHIAGPYEEIVSILRERNPLRPPSVWVQAESKPSKGAEQRPVVVPADEAHPPDETLSVRSSRVPASHVHQFDAGRCTVCGWEQPDILPHQDSGPAPGPGQPM